MFSDNFRRGEGGKGRKGSKAVSKLADIGWKAFQAVNTALPEGQAIQPKWAAQPLLKSYERSAPPLGFPRETDSLCPACVKSVRNGVISGDIPLDILMNSHPGEVKAQIVEENGQVLMRKTCPTHGEFVDVLATDAKFLERNFSKGSSRFSSAAISNRPKTRTYITTELATSNSAAERYSPST
jgi:hypothetical protein